MTAARTAEREHVQLLRASMPFQVVSDDTLRRIAEIARSVTFEPGQVIYKRGSHADDVYVISHGRVEHILGPGSGANLLRILTSGEVFGWAALLKTKRNRLADTVAQERTECLAIDAQTLLRILAAEPDSADVVMSRFATMITRDFTVPEWIAQLRPVPRERQPRPSTGVQLVMFRLAQWLRSPNPYLMLVGFALFIGFWYAAVDVWKLPRFTQMPGPVTVFKEWTSRHPTFGISLYTADYYTDIFVSIRRVAIAFTLATALGIPLGLFLGWSRKFREYVFPVFELLRPIPPLAWVPLAIVMFSGLETPVIFLTFLASFYATALNTLLGVESIDETYFRAAYCLGANRWQVFREVVAPGAMPFIFTGLQISMGVAWFSLVAAEMVSGRFGLGYLIMNSYTTVEYPTIIIGMISLGVVGYATSALVRLAGDRLMQWRARDLALR